MGERSVVLRLTLVLVSLLFQFLGLVFFFGFGFVLILGVTGAVKSTTGLPPLGRAVLPVAAGLVLFVMGRAAWSAQKRLGKYLKAYKEKLKASGKEDFASFVPFYGSYDYYLIYDYTNLFLNTLMKDVERYRDPNSPVHIEEMGRREIVGAKAHFIRELPEGFLIFGRWKEQPGTIFNINDKVNRIVKGREAVTALFNMVELPRSMSFIAMILFFFPFHEKLLYAWFMGRKKKSPVTPLNVRG